VIAFVIGCVLGMLAATLGKHVDDVLSRIVDLLMAIPQLIFALLALSIFGTGLVNMILVIAVLDSTKVFRLVRAVTQGIVAMEYIEAAKLRGEGLFYLIRREILPNAMAPLVAEFGMRLSFVLLSIAALSFLGLGIQPPTAEWASMVAENKVMISFGIMTPLIPGIFIALLTISINLVVDWKLHQARGLKD
jgi:peptide/nickel transport system permease protein